MRVLLALIALAAAVPAAAADTWTEPFPGIRYLHRSTSEPKEIHAVVVDLTRPEIRVRATKAAEKGKTVSSFASLVGAAAAVNGDFFSLDGNFTPTGLAIGAGTKWHDDTSSQKFIACTAAPATCTVETTNTVTTVDAAWKSAVGGKNALVKNGVVVQTAALDTSCGEFCTTAHPRTAAGVSADGHTLFLVVVEGRQDPVFGMSTNKLAQLMLSLGCDDAINLDGGGSSAMVVDGARVSGRPDNEPAERAVGNHLAVIWDESLATTARLVGYVREDDITDATAGISGVGIALSDGQTATTNGDGFYEIAAAPLGAVTVTATKAGFTQVVADKVVESGVTNWKSIALVRAPADAGTAPADAGQAPPPQDAGSADPPAVDDDAGVAGEGEGEGEGEPSGEGEGEGEPSGEGEGEGEGDPADDGSSTDKGALDDTGGPAAACACVSAAPVGVASSVPVLLIVLASALRPKRRRPR